MHLVPSLGRQAERLVEAGDLHHLAERHLQRLGDLFHHLARQPVLLVLDFGQRMDQRSRFASVLFNDAVNLLVTHGVVSFLFMSLGGRPLRGLD